MTAQSDIDTVVGKLLELRGALSKQQQPIFDAITSMASDAEVTGFQFASVQQAWERAVRTAYPDPNSNAGSPVSGFVPGAAVVSRKGK